MFRQMSRQFCEMSTKVTKWVTVTFCERFVVYGREF